MHTLSRPQEAVMVEATPQKRKPRFNLYRIVVIVTFLAPAAVLYALFVVLPVGQAAFYSLFRWNGLGPVNDFRGFDNLIHAFGDAVFLQSLGHSFFFMALSILIQLPLALGLALLVGRRLPGRSIFRVIFFLPFVLSEVIAAVIWNFMYQPEYGTANTLLKNVVPGFQPVAWLGDTNVVLYAIFAVLCWKYVGFHMILYITGLQQIPAEIEEAATIDGANGFQNIRYIILPLLGSTIRLTVYLSVLGALQNFELIYVMTTGGPVHSSETITTYLYNFGFKRFQLGYGSAVAVILFGICFVFSLVYQRYALRRDFEGGVASRN